MSESIRPLDFSRSSSFFGDVRPGPLARGLLDRLEDLLVGRLDALGLDDRGEHRLAPQRLLGVGLALLDDLALVAPGDPQVRLARDALVRERVQHLVPQLAGARLDERVGDVERWRA